MSTPSLGRSQLLLMVQEIIRAQFIQLLLAVSAAPELRALRSLS